MSKELAARSVVAMGLVLAAATLYQSSRGQGGNTYKRLWSIAAISLVLSLLVDFTPQIVGPLAVLVGLPYLAKIMGYLGTTSGSVSVAPPGLVGPVG